MIRPARKDNHRRVFALIVLLTMAGCVSPSPPSEVPAAPARADLAAQPTTSGASTMPTNTTQSAPFVLRYDGQTNTSAFVCANATVGDEVCQWTPTDPGGYRSLTNGSYNHAHLTLTWTATSPATQQLHLSLNDVVPDSGDWNTLCQANATSSPFPFDCDLKGHNATFDLLLFVRPPNYPTGNPPLGGWVGTDQPFHVEITLTNTTRQV